MPTVSQARRIHVNGNIRRLILNAVFPVFPVFRMSKERTMSEASRARPEEHPYAATVFLVFQAWTIRFRAFQAVSTSIWNTWNTGVTSRCSAQSVNKGKRPQRLSGLGNTGTPGTPLFETAAPASTTRFNPGVRSPEQTLDAIARR